MGPARRAAPLSADLLAGPAGRVLVRPSPRAGARGAATHGTGALGTLRRPETGGDAGRGPDLPPGAARRRSPAGDARNVSAVAVECWPEARVRRYRCRPHGDAGSGGRRLVERPARTIRSAGHGAPLRHVHRARRHRARRRSPLDGHAVGPGRGGLGRVRSVSLERAGQSGNGCLRAAPRGRRRCSTAGLPAGTDPVDRAGLRPLRAGRHGQRSRSRRRPLWSRSDRPVRDRSDAGGLRHPRSSGARFAVLAPGDRTDAVLGRRGAARAGPSTHRARGSALSRAADSRGPL
jgi:hypothetical protein